MSVGPQRATDDGRDGNEKRPASPMGETGRVAATLQKMGIGGCGLAAPSIDEGEPALVRRVLLIMLKIIAQSGKKGR